MPARSGLKIRTTLSKCGARASLPTSAHPKPCNHRSRPSVRIHIQLNLPPVVLVRVYSAQAGPGRRADIATFVSKDTRGKGGGTKCSASLDHWFGFAWNPVDVLLSCY